MDTPVKAKSAADLRDYLAEERTFFSWVRTGIALRANDRETSESEEFSLGA
jgi:uncharacterized membrane protein YidH (DUF202 family)